MADYRKSLLLVESEDGVKRVWRDLDSSYDPPLSSALENYSEYISKIAAQALTYVIECDGVVAAAVSFYANDMSGYQAYISQLAVNRLFRGEGLGAALLDCVKAVAKERGLRVVRLSVLKDNVRARALYEREGFLLESENGDDALYLIFEL